MKRIKNIFLMIFLLLLALITTGCSYAAATTGSENGEKNGTKLDGGCAMISFYNYVQYGSGRYVAYKLTYDYEYYKKKKSILINLLEELGESFKNNGYNVTVNGFSGEMIASLTFETTEEYLRNTDYNGFVSEKTEYDSIQKSAFYNEYTIKSTTLFTDIEKEYKFVGRVYSVGCVKAGIDKDDVLLQYVYGTPYKENTVRSNADSVSYYPDKNIYLHVFNMKFDTRDREIVLTQRTPNTPVWYGVAIAAGLLAMAAPLTVYLIKKKKKE